MDTILKFMVPIFICLIGTISGDQPPLLMCPMTPPMLPTDDCTENCTMRNMSSCPEGKMCCSTGCGLSCQTPVPGNLSMPCPMCMDPCEFGFMGGTGGCPSCECAENPCLTTTCPEGEDCITKMPEGSMYAESLCVAVPPPPPANLTIPCPMCTESCEFGFILGSDGCPQCECAEDPCMSTVCPEGKTCHVVLPEGALYAETECVQAPHPAQVQHEESAGNTVFSNSLAVLFTFITAVLIQ